tara:strand:+ start:1198 stop:1617 length:420 start_codon:yes stop_codon:yes gene_type:complete
MSTETKKDDGYLVQKIGMWNTPQNFKAFQAETDNWIKGHKEEDQFSLIHILNLTWNFLAEATSQKPKAELAKEIAFEILCNEQMDGYIPDMNSIYEPPDTDEGQNRDPKNPYSGLTLDAEYRLNELQDIILLVLKGGEK